MKTADIRTNHHEASCDVCGRTLLRGEQAEPFLAGGSRRHVCELCTGRAAHEGWIREVGGDDLVTRRPTEQSRTRSLLDRLRSRREQLRATVASAGGDGATAPERPRRRAARHELPPDDGTGDPAISAYHAREGDTPPPREPRHVRAVPTNADAKMERALQVFNGSDCRRTVAGVARSLGPPAVNVRPLAEAPSIVAITVMWELSWYRFEVDLSDEGSGARRVDQGYELTDLTADDHAINAAADERGLLQLAG